MDFCHLGVGTRGPFGLFEWLVMPQGLRNAPAPWQGFMNSVLQKHVGRICYVYMDDISIFPDSLEEHRRDLRPLVDAFREAGIIVSKMMSQLFTDRIEFLGHVISTQGIEVEVEKILRWPTLRNS